MQAILLDAAAKKHDYKLSPAEAESRFRSAFATFPSPRYSPEIDGHESERIWWREIVREVTQFPQSVQFERFFEDLFSYYELPEAWTFFPDTLPFFLAS